MNQQDLLNDPMILRELVMDHYQYPHHHGLKKDRSYIWKHMASDSCIDDITVEIKIDDNQIQDICFDGEACTISTSSTSTMTDLLIGKSLEDAKEIIRQYDLMIEGKEYNAELLGEAVIMKNIYKQANRIKCATIGWNAVKEAIEESEATDGKQE